MNSFNDAVNDNDFEGMGAAINDLIKKDVKSKIAHKSLLTQEQLTKKAATKILNLFNKYRPNHSFIPYLKARYLAGLALFFVTLNVFNNKN